MGSHVLPKKMLKGLVSTESKREISSIADVVM